MSVHSSIIGGLPSSKLFSFPPYNPATPVAPAPTEFSIMRPFNISEGFFLAALDARVPITIAATYAVTVKALNRYNRANGKQPWAISKTAAFRFFVVLHNIFLAVYSAWTFWGMLGGIRRSIVNPFGPGGLAATADSACRLHGAPGLGNSVYYNEHLSRFETSGPNAPTDVVGANGLPNTAQMGRIWNEGLAYYGWLFYLSKFYEVLDTFIILAKGKPSSTLQTYHHAGAMLCMWAGMRYMAAPIWVFVQFNSFIHALMYTYYTVTAFSIRVPVFIKRSLTSMQITQFLVGASLAMCHSFIYYFAPARASASATGSATSKAAVESVRALLFGSGADARRIKTVVDKDVSYVSQPCIVSSGETFAIWLNVVYLAPLTYLFISFFISSYVKRSNAANKSAGKEAAAARHLSNVNVDVARAEKAGWDAARGIEREVYGGERMVRSASGSPIRTEASAASSRSTTRRRG